MSCDYHRIEISMKSACGLWILGLNKFSISRILGRDANDLILRVDY